MNRSIDGETMREGDHQALLAALYQGNPSAVFTVKPSGEILDANPAAARLTCSPLTALRSKNLGEFAWDVPSNWSDVLLIEGRSTGPIQTVLHTPGGDRTLKVWVIPSQLAGGVPGPRHVVAFDITDDRRSLEAVRVSESKYRHLVDTSHDLVWSVNRAGQFIFLNPATRSIYGWEREEMLGRCITDFVEPGRREQDAMAFESILKGENLFHYETEHKAKDGRPVYLNINAVPLRDADGQIIGVSGTAVDISHRKQAEVAIERLAAFPRFNPYAVLEFNSNGDIAYYNAAAFEMARSFGKNHPREILPEATERLVQECLANNQSRQRFEHTLDLRTLSWSFFPIQQSKVVHCYANEITERQNLERQLRQAQKMECVGQLAGGIAHDFNNILTIIQGHSALLQAEAKGHEFMEESLAEINLATDRAITLTQQLLTFSRKKVIQARPLDLNDVIRNLSRLLRPLLSEDIDVAFHFAPELPQLLADLGMIEQILLNLVINARDAMPAGGRLTIGTFGQTLTVPESERIPDSRSGHSICLFVTDTGCGISRENLSHIFEPFFTTKEVGKGTGLGLATVYGIVKQHHGWIQVASDVGRGTSFKIYLPILDHIETAPPPARPEPCARRRDGTILVVEDEAPLRELIKLILTRHGFRVIEAPNGNRALELWHQRKSEINLLLSDVVMPDGINGVELSSRLQEERPDLKVILSSGYSPQVAGRDITQMDRISYLQKPYQPHVLLELIEDVLGKK
jgi:two-component system cell cycle sensor histidine kinase/response regulator CckA